MNKSKNRLKNNSTNKKFLNNYFEINELLFFGVFFVLIIIFWELPVIFPIKFFVVFIHEIGHVFATIITGGTVNKIIVDWNLAGITLSSGGNLFIIASSGYLISFIVGLLIIYSSYNKNFCKYFCYSLSAIILLVTTNLLDGNVQILLGLAFFIIFFFVPKIQNQLYAKYFLRLFGLISCLYVSTDIKQDLLTTTIRETDTQILENLTGLPAILFGFIWLLITIIGLYFAFRFVLSRK